MKKQVHKDNPMGGSGTADTTASTKVITNKNASNSKSKSSSFKKSDADKYIIKQKNKGLSAEEQRQWLLNQDFIKAFEKRDFVKMVELIEKKADVNAKDQFGLTPLFNAILSEDKDMVSFLKVNGAKEEDEDAGGVEPGGEIPPEEETPSEEFNREY